MQTPMNTELTCCSAPNVGADLNEGKCQIIHERPLPDPNRHTYTLTHRHTPLSLETDNSLSNTTCIVGLQMRRGEAFQYNCAI